MGQEVVSIFRRGAVEAAAMRSLGSARAALCFGLAKGHYASNVPAGVQRYRQRRTPASSSAGCGAVRELHQFLAGERQDEEVHELRSTRDGIVEDVG
jgi:hypothetical protein